MIASITGAREGLGARRGGESGDLLGPRRPSRMLPGCCPGVFPALPSSSGRPSRAHRVGPPATEPAASLHSRHRRQRHRASNIVEIYHNKNVSKTPPRE